MKKVGKEFGLGYWLVSESMHDIVYCDNDFFMPICTGGEDYGDPLVTQVRLSEVNSFEEVLIPILDDRLFEGSVDEQFTVRISLPTCNVPGGLIIENAEAVVSIQDNDRRPGKITLHRIKYKTRCTQNVQYMYELSG